MYNVNDSFVSTMTKVAASYRPEAHVFQDTICLNCAINPDCLFKITREGKEISPKTIFPFSLCYIVVFVVFYLRLVNIAFGFGCLEAFMLGFVCHDT